MDPKKLDALRARYRDARGDQIYDPDFRAVAATQWHDGGLRNFPFSGIPTLLDLPAAEGPDGLDVALIGVPMDLGVTNRGGARFGPRAVRTIERIGPYNHALKVAPQAVLACADIGDVPFRSRYSLSDSLADIESFFGTVRAAGAKPLAIGGDHSVSYPILKALGADPPVGMGHIDAQCDSAEYLWEFSYESGMTVVPAETFAEKGVAAIIAETRAVLAGQPFYITIDVDGLDPAFAPGTGTPEVGGLTPREVQALLRGLVGAGPLIGGDVVEVAPQYDANTTTAQVGGQMAFEILSLMAVEATAAALD